MVFANKYAEIFLDKFKNFKNSDQLKEAIALYAIEDEPISINVIFTGLTHYVCDVLESNHSNVTQEEIEIYNYIEESITKFCEYPFHTDEKDFDDAACVSFLENLLNYASSGRIEYARFIPLLGKNSRMFCKAWDEFTGVRSPGLWTDSEWAEIEKNMNHDIQ